MHVQEVCYRMHRVAGFRATCLRGRWHRLAGLSATCLRSRLHRVAGFRATWLRGIVVQCAVCSV